MSRRASSRKFCEFPRWIWGRNRLKTLNKGNGFGKNLNQFLLNQLLITTNFIKQGLLKSETLRALGAFEWVLRDDIVGIEGSKYITSRWEDVRKDTGLLRSRWVLREYANTQADADYYSPTPDPTLMEVIHVFATVYKHEIRYLDLQRASLCAPELDVIYTDAPER